MVTAGRRVAEVFGEDQVAEPAPALLQGEPAPAPGADADGIPSFPFPARVADPFAVPAPGQAALTAAARVRAASRPDEHGAAGAFEQARPGQRLGHLPAADQRGKLVQVLFADLVLGRVPGGQRQAGHARGPSTPRLAITPLTSEAGDLPGDGLHAGDGPVLDP
jgi:hypothetical protein